MGIYDRVPCKTLHRSKFNLSHRSSFTGDIGYVYPTMCEEVIPGDVWKLGHEQVTKFSPMVSPLMSDMYVDTHHMFVPMRLMYERWHEFISGGKDGDYVTPLKSLQDLYTEYISDDYYICHYLRDLYEIMKADVATWVSHIYDDNTIYTNETFWQGLSYDKFALMFGTDVLTAQPFMEQWFRTIPFHSCNLLDYLGFPVMDKRTIDCIYMKFGSTEGACGMYYPTMYTDSTYSTALTSSNYTTYLRAIYETDDGGHVLLTGWENAFSADYTSCAPVFAYWYCYNEWFRHPEFDKPVYCKWLRDGSLGVSDDEFEVSTSTTDNARISFVPFTRTWKKDYFTASLPTAQRGTAPALPISGILPILVGYPTATTDGYTSMVEGLVGSGYGSSTDTTSQYTTGDSYTLMYSGSASLVDPNTSTSVASKFPLGVDISKASTFDIRDLRLANAIQRFMELNNVAGNRYTGFLKVQYGTAPADDILQRPDYFGHSRETVYFSEITSTVATDDDPLGTRAGKGSSSGNDLIRPYHPKEHGVIMNFCSIVPQVNYCGQGINRMWQRKTKYDYYNSLFAGIGEQEIKVSELVWNVTSLISNSILGYQGRFDEYRSRESNVKGLLRGSQYGTYVYSRRFNCGITYYPKLNSDFVHINFDKSTCFAVPTEPAFVMHFGNIAEVYRPMPEYSVPSL